MIDRKHMDLITKVIDGEASESETELLREIASKNPEVAGAIDEIRFSIRAISQSGLVDPPADLKLNLMRNIRALGMPSKPRYSLLAPSLSAIRSRLNVRFAWGFAAGASLVLLIGIAVSGISRGTWLDRTYLYGTAILNRGATGTDVIEKGRFKVGNSQGEAEASANDRTAIAKVEIVSEDTANIHLQFDREELECMGFQQEYDSTGTCEIGSEFVRFRHSGSNTYAVFFKKKVDCGAQFSVTISCDGLMDIMVLSTCSKKCGNGDSDY